MRKKGEFSLYEKARAAEEASEKTAESVVEAFSRQKDDPLHPGKRNFLMEVNLTVVVTGDDNPERDPLMKAYVEQQFRTVFQIQNFNILETTPIPKEFN